MSKFASPLSARFGGITRGFQFDRVLTYTGPSPEDLIALNQTMMVAFKTVSVPLKTRDKIEKMLKQFGRKKEIEAMGRYVSLKLSTRSSSEIPRVLPSKLLPESEQGASVVDKLFRGSQQEQIKLLMELQGEVPEESEIFKLAISHADDARHKALQITYSPHAALALVGHFYASMFAANFRILTEISKRCTNYRPRSILEYDAGPAAGTSAAISVWDGGFENIVAVEPSLHLSNIGRFLTSDYASMRWQGGLYEVTDLYDLILLEYSLCKMKGQESRNILIKNMWNRLNEGGILVVLERGTPTGFRMIHAAREVFIGELGEGNFHFVAPCPHESVCPLSITGRDWCHFSQRVEMIPQYIYRKTPVKMPIEDVKFSYIAIRKSAGPRFSYGSEVKAPDAVSKSYFWPRIVKPCIKSGGHVLLDVCSPPRTFERLTVSKGKDTTGGYKAARSCLWGDLWRYPRRLCRPEARIYFPEESKKNLERLARRARRALKMGSEEEPDKSLVNCETIQKVHYGS